MYGSGGPICIMYGEPALDQLWDKIKGLTQMINAVILKILQLIGVEEGHGLSNFSMIFRKG